MRADPNRTFPLADEHPELHLAAVTMIKDLRSLAAGLAGVDGAPVWMQHIEFAKRAGEVASHLEAAVLLASSRHFTSALAVLRTGLEHRCLDELLLLAERFREIVPADPETFGVLRAEYEAGVEGWTANVVSFDPTRKGVALVRRGLDVKNDAGEVVEQLSPYYPAIEHHDAILGPVDIQDDVVEAFTDPENMRDWARRNRTLYERYLKWSAIIDNFELNGLWNERQTTQLGVHFRFLSAFTHPTGSGYSIVGRDSVYPGPRISSAHLLGELVLLYVCVIAVGELKSFFAFVDARPTLTIDGRGSMIADCGEIAAMTSYLWFPRLGEPTEFDFYEEANRRAYNGGRGVFPFVGAVRPDQIDAGDVGYYRDPLKRLAQLHVGANEMSTGFGYRPLW